MASSEPYMAYSEPYMAYSETYMAYSETCGLKPAEMLHHEPFSTAKI